MPNATPEVVPVMEVIQCSVSPTEFRSRYGSLKVRRSGKDSYLSIGGQRVPVMPLSPVADGAEYSLFMRTYGGKTSTLVPVEVGERGGPKPALLLLEGTGPNVALSCKRLRKVRVLAAQGSMALVEAQAEAGFTLELRADGKLLGTHNVVCHHAEVMAIK